MAHVPYQITVTDAETGKSYTYDANMTIATADDGLAFYISQLSTVEAKIYEAKYPSIRYAEFVPVDMSQPEWIDSVNYISYDAVTMGKFIGTAADDLPQSEINASISTIPVFYGGNSYGYSLDELRKSQQMRIPLDVTKGRMSYRGFQEHAQRVAYFGDSDRGITGLFNNANVALDNSTVDWSTASGPEIVADMNQLLTNIWVNSKETHVPNTFLLPNTKYAQISEQAYFTSVGGSDVTILEYFKRNNLYSSLTNQPLDIQSVQQLNDAGVGGVGRMMAYEKNADNLVMHMPIMWRALAPQPKGLRVNVPAEYKFGGVEFRYPGSAAYRDDFSG